VAAGATVVTLAAGALAPAGSLAAAGGYGPPTAGGGGLPTGFGVVLGAKTICGTGGSITVRLGPWTVTVRVPAGPFGGCALIAVTLPVGTRRPNRAGLIPFPLTFGVHVLRQSGGVVLPGPFSPPLNVTVSGSGLGSRTAVMERENNGVVKLLESQFNSTARTFSFSFATPGDFYFFSHAKGT
jgi:hypothetical protein